MAYTEFYDIAINKARTLSKRAALGWSIIDQESELATAAASMLGLDCGHLEQSIAQYAHQATELFLCFEPPESATNAITQAIEQSEIQRITLGKALNDNPAWTQWLQQWPGSQEVLPYNPVVDKLSYGYHSIRQQQRPWVTSITAASLSGFSQPLANLAPEFDFVNYIANLSQQSRAVIYTLDQQPLLDLLPDENYAGEPLELFEVGRVDALKGIYRHCAQEMRCSVLLVCNMPMLHQVLETFQVDEVVHHLVKNDVRPLKAEVDAHPSLDMENWTLTSSAVVGQCSRVVYARQADRVAALLGSRLN